VLAGDRATAFDAGVEYRAGQDLCRLGLGRRRVVVQHQRVQVAVAGVEHVRDPHPVFGG
jgi:hypothetical protein